MSLYTRLLEVTYNQVLSKQRSIHNLWPAFTKRVGKVKASGGVKLINQTPEVWNFDVASASGKGNYNTYLRFKNIPEMLVKFVPNVKLWNSDKTDIDYNKLGPEVLNKVDMEFSCACKADLYWGMKYIKTQKKAQFGEEENRPPDIRNPRQYGIMCKHGQALLDKLPSYNFTFNGFLKFFYGKDIQKIVDEVKKRLPAFKQAGEELKKKAELEKEKPVAYGKGGKPVEVPPKEEENPRGELNQNSGPPNAAS